VPLDRIVQQKIQQSVTQIEFIGDRLATAVIDGNLNPL